MNAITISDPQHLKDAILDILKENPDILKAAVQEFLSPNAKETSDARRERMRALIQQDFDRYEDVFKSLA